jgi:hypothetical protein
VKPGEYGFCHIRQNDGTWKRVDYPQPRVRIFKCSDGTWCILTIWKNNEGHVIFASGQIRASYPGKHGKLLGHRFLQRMRYERNMAEIRERKKVA